MPPELIYWAGFLIGAVLVGTFGVIIGYRFGIEHGERREYARLMEDHDA